MRKHKISRTKLSYSEIWLDNNTVNGKSVPDSQTLLNKQNKTRLLWMVSVNIQLNGSLIKYHMDLVQNSKECYSLKRVWVCDIMSYSVSKLKKHNYFIIKFSLQDNHILFLLWKCLQFSEKY